MADIHAGQLLRRPSIIDEHLANLLQTVCIEVEAGTELLNDGILHRLTELLHSERGEQAAEILAEMAKSEDNRIVFIQQQVIPSLVILIRNSSAGKLRQACRAVGNMCFESQSGRQIVLTEGGIAALVGKLKELKPVRATTAEENSVHYMLCGALHTICMDHEEVQKEAIKLGTFPVLMDYLRFSTDPTVLRFSLNIISAFLDNGEEIIELALQHNLAPIVSDILKSHMDNNNVREAVLDVLSTFHLLEKPLIQMQLYHAGLISHILDIINTSLDGTESVERVASEILVIIVSHDGIAQLAFEDERVDLVREAMDWMKGYHEHLKGTGALVVGNLATSDLRSTALAKHSDLIATLFSVLQGEYSSEEMSVKVKHAALSALRNLTICEAAKPLIAPYLPVLLEYVQCEMPMLVFKAVGCVRCLARSNGDVATRLAYNTAFTSGLCELPVKYKYHAGIQGEVPRLLCTLIVEAIGDQTIPAILECKVVPLILEMTSTKEYPQVQVEAWLAIQKIVKAGPYTRLLLSHGALGYCESSLGDETNPNVRILALSTIRLLAPSLSKEDETETLSAHMTRLVVSADIPASKLAGEIKHSLEQ